MIWQWQLDPIPVAGVFYLALAYALGVGPLRWRYFPEPFPRRHAARFGAGIALFLLLLVSPLHLWAEVYLLSAHMLQFMILSYVIPVLILSGTPAWLLKPLLLHRWIRPLAQTLTRPWLALVLFNLIFAIWHVPAFLLAATFNEWLHSLMYLSLFGAAVLMWWPVLSPLPELPRLAAGKQVIYLVLLFLAHTPISAWMGFATDLLYPWYALAPRVFGLSPMEDQQLAGGIMGLFVMLALTIAASIAFFQWLRETEKASQDESAAPEG
ncbi:MAG: cytochrome c oxidase assembly protein [Truepera sp.]|nr:cytochrome c oxidase assembly protein [Truepera sp.]